MLEDLDLLLVRLAALISHTQQLTAEADALRVSLAQVQTERDGLLSRLTQEGTQAKALTRKVDAYASEQASLQGFLSREDPSRRRKSRRLKKARLF